MTLGLHAADIPEASNTRWLDGYPTRPGRKIAPGLLLRGELLVSDGHPVFARYDTSATPKYQALGLNVILDLRSVNEAKRVPSAWAMATGAKVIALPIRDGADGTDNPIMAGLMNGMIQRFTADDLGRYYVHSLETAGPTYGRILTFLANSQGPTLIHCAAGKDRTGLAVALLLGMLGTPRDVILDDYHLSQVARPDRADLYATRLSSWGVDIDNVRPIFEAPIEAMKIAMHHIEETYGTFDGYLTTAGRVEPSTLDRLNEALVVDA